LGTGCSGLLVRVDTEVGLMAVALGPAVALSRTAVGHTGGSVAHMRAMRSISMRWSLSTCWANW
jgi:microcystin-dependent protein